ncbi:hypothetical protein DFJ73DRAFT_825958 [Zopfochytrium polystomum]|nr:hypothetical protein DFJ73DRAFT_825958 [Zopfochytrium polystomum]
MAPPASPASSVHQQQHHPPPPTPAPPPQPAFVPIRPAPPPPPPSATAGNNTSDTAPVSSTTAPPAAAPVVVVANQSQAHGGDAAFRHPPLPLQTSAHHRFMVVPNSSVTVSSAPSAPPLQFYNPNSNQAADSCSNNTSSSNSINSLHGATICCITTSNGSAPVRVPQMLPPPFPHFILSSFPQGDPRHYSYDPSGGRSGQSHGFLALPAFGPFAGPVHHQIASQRAPIYQVQRYLDSHHPPTHVLASGGVGVSAVAPLEVAPQPLNMTHVSTSGAIASVAPQAALHSMTLNEFSMEDVRACTDPDVIEAATILFGVRSPSSIEEPPFKSSKSSRRSKRLKVDTEALEERLSAERTSNVYLTPLTSPKVAGADSGPLARRSSRTANKCSEQTASGEEKHHDIVQPSPRDQRYKRSSPEARKVFKLFLSNAAVLRKRRQEFDLSDSDDSDKDPSDDECEGFQVNSETLTTRNAHSLSALPSPPSLAERLTPPLHKIEAPTESCSLRRKSSMSAADENEKSPKLSRERARSESEASTGSASHVVKLSDKVELPVLPREVDMNWYRDTSAAQPVTWSKGAPMTIPPDTPSASDLTKEELQLCQTLRLHPTQYLKIKETAIAATYTRPPFRKKELRMWFPIDVNKINKLYDWFLDLNWIPKSDEDWLKRERWYRRTLASSA